MGQKRRLSAQDVWEAFAGKQLILAGSECGQKQRFLENILYKKKNLQDAFSVSTEIDQENEAAYVLFFADPEEEPEQSLLALAQAAAGKPKALIVLSDYCVYGKQFGAPKRLKEHELGYASHMNTGDGGKCSFFYRMLEHFAARMAREDGAAIRIARIGELPEGQIACGDAWDDMLTDLIRLFLWGENGEAYNLTEGEEPTMISPLTPNPVVADTGKLELL